MSVSSTYFTTNSSDYSILSSSSAGGLAGSTHEAVVYSAAAPAVSEADLAFELVEHEDAFMTALAESLGEEEGGPVGKGIADAIDPDGGAIHFKKLGEGAAGSVHQIWTSGGQNVALKILKLELVNSGEKLVSISHGRVGGEGMGLHFCGIPHVLDTRAVLTLDNDRKVHLISDFDVLKECDGHKIIGSICEYVHSTELFECVRLGTKIFSQQKVALQIAQAAGVIHARGGMHRDIKLENILVDEHGDAHLIDFGYAKVVKSEKSERTYTKCGTPDYAAPELFTQKAEYTSKVDVYSLGVTMFMMKFGFSPFHDCNVQQMMSMKRKGKIQQLRGEKLVWTKISKIRNVSHYRRLIFSMMGVDPDARPTMAEVAERLREFVAAED